MGEYVMVGQLVIVNKIGTAVAVRFHPDWRSWWNQQSLVHELGGILVNLVDATDAKEVVLNLVPFPDLGGDGLNMLVRLHRRTQAKEIALTLSNLGPALRERFRRDQLDRLFKIVNDEAQALAALSQADQKDSSA